MNAPAMPTVAAVVAAAGRSRRMGSPKQLLPWGATTVLRAVVDHLHAAGVDPIICVVGHLAEEMTAHLAGTGAVVVRNEHYTHSEMLSSYQAGIAALAQASPACIGALLALGDQPHIPTQVMAQVRRAALDHPDTLWIPSHDFRRGHPIYLPRDLWPDLLALSESDSLRTLLQRYQPRIDYVTVDTDAILRDLDTPADYASLSAEA